jgi:tryptophan halogenase
MPMAHRPVDRIENVTIVSGGTAGWLSAAMLNCFLNERRDGAPVAITLIESPTIPTVGVGEATVPGMRSLIQRLGLDEAEFMLRCNATFKYAVRFDGWNLNESGQGISFLHPFNMPEHLRGKDPTYHFHRYGLDGDNTALVDNLLPNGAMIRARRAPRPFDGDNYDGVIRYSYHLDAALFANYLRDITTGLGIIHIRDDVTDVKLDERGHVTELTLERGGAHPVDFVVDCTGFRGRIIGDALQEPFQSWSDNLLCDSALAIQLPHIDPKKIPPATTATALGAGWVWNLPLYNRVGTGYVFSSAFRSPEEALDEFVTHLEQSGYRVEEEPRLIRMQIGRRKRTWVGNCVAIGLSGAFVEPLEATAIHTIAASVRQLVANWPDRQVNPAMADRYNRSTTELLDNVLEFIMVHYLTSNRPDPFWRAARNDVSIPPHLAENLALWRHLLTAVTDVKGLHLFSAWSFLCVLYAKGYFEEVSLPLEGSLGAEDWHSYVENMQKIRKNYSEALPDHYEFLTRLRNSTSLQLLGVGATNR